MPKVSCTRNRASSVAGRASKQAKQAKQLRTVMTEKPQRQGANSCCTLTVLIRLLAETTCTTSSPRTIRDCYSADTPSRPVLKCLLQGRGGAAERQYRQRLSSPLIPARSSAPESFRAWTFGHSGTVKHADTPSASLLKTHTKVRRGCSRTPGTGSGCGPPGAPGPSPSPRLVFG